MPEAGGQGWCPSPPGTEAGPGLAELNSSAGSRAERAGKPSAQRQGDEGGSWQENKRANSIKSCSKELPKGKGESIPVGQEGRQEQATKKAPWQHQQRHSRVGKSMGTGFPQCLPGVLVLLLHWQGKTQSCCTAGVGNFRALKNEKRVSLFLRGRHGRKATTLPSDLCVFQQDT